MAIQIRSLPLERGVIGEVLENPFPKPKQNGPLTKAFLGFLGRDVPPTKDIDTLTARASSSGGKVKSDTAGARVLLAKAKAGTGALAPGTFVTLSERVMGHYSGTNAKTAKVVKQGFPQLLDVKELNIKPQQTQLEKRTLGFFNEVKVLGAKSAGTIERKLGT